MLRPCLYLGLIQLCLLLGSQPGEASTTPVSNSSLNAVASATTASQLSTPLPPSQNTPLIASTTLGKDANDSTKFYTITAALREIYDNNITTANTGRISSFETEITPSILFDFPRENNDFSLRETFDALYYSNRPSDPMDFSDEVVAQLQHSFSQRFSFSLAEQFRYYTEPSLFENTGTLYYSGAYISNTLNGSFNAQWTPLVSTLFTYANTVVNYLNSTTALGNNSLENNGSITLGFAILPKLTLTFGGIVDDIAYSQVARGYTTLTGNTGVDWQALPSLTLSAAVGGSVTETEQGGGSTPTPYASFSLSWQLGARSSLNFNYVHEIVPSDVTQSQGQEADRFSTLFRYDINPDLNVHLQSTLTHGVYSQWLLAANSVGGFSENDFAIDVGLTYHIDSHFDVSLGNTYSGVDSGLSYRDYNRNQVYLGVRGTY